jgi:hypothetical protein
LKTLVTAGRRDCLRLLVLAPHRDCRRLLRLLSPELFRRGLYGAWSFPQAVPLAVLSAPFTEEELKACARSLRALNPAGKEGGRIRAGAMAKASLRREGGGEEAGFWIAGPSLNLAVPEPFPAGEEKVLRRVAPPVLGAALIREDEGVPDMPAPPLSFRAAALANMTLRPLDDSGYSFCWRLGKPAWLPRIPKTSRGARGDR